MGSAFFAPLVGLLVIHAGWREAATVSGALMLAALVPAFLIIRNLPEDMGLEPDGGEPPASESRGASARVRSVTPEVSVTARQAFGTSTYWLMVLAMSLRIVDRQR